MWKLITALLLFLMIAYFSIGIFLRGLNGVVKKQIFIYRWDALAGESSKNLDKESGKWIWSYERGVRGDKAIFFGFLYMIYGLLLFLLSLAVLMMYF